MQTQTNTQWDLAPCPLNWVLHLLHLQLMMLDRLADAIQLAILFILVIGAYLWLKQR